MFNNILFLLIMSAAAISGFLLFVENRRNVVIEKKTESGKKIFAAKIKKSTMAGEFKKSKNKIEILGDSPFYNKLDCKLFLEMASHISINIKDSLGNQIKTIVDDYYNEGTYKTDFDFGKFDSGTYFIEFNSIDANEEILLAVFNKL